MSPWKKPLARLQRGVQRALRRAMPPALRPPAAPPSPEARAQQRQAALVLGPLGELLTPQPLAFSDWPDNPQEAALRARDAWFHSHYVFAPHIIHHAIGARQPMAGAKVLDLGCGDGIMALGVLELGAAEVWGTDLTRAFDTLPAKAQATLGIGPLPATLGFRQGTLGEPLPFSDGDFDCGYSWSVFEHVDGVPWLLAEVRRVLRPGGHFFLQIEPLYFSPFGSHLLRLIETPWQHLREDDAAYLARAAAATDHVAEIEKDLLYQNNAFEDVKRYLIGEYRSLNKLTTVQLVTAVRAAGLEILGCEIGQNRGLPVPPELLERHEMHDLVTNEIRLLLRRPRQTPARMA